MPTPLFSSGSLALLFSLLTLSAALWTASVAQAQTQASCTFTLFPLTVNLPNLGDVQLSPAGINDFGTVVGTANLYKNGLPITVGFIRWSNGGINLPLGESMAGSLVARNDSGISIGFRGSFANPTGQQILLNGATVTPIVLNINNYSFLVSGINIWNSIVGMYFTVNSGQVLEHGFKRWSNGNAISVEYPTNPGTTSLAGINDSGTIVGDFITIDTNHHGFIYHNGNFAKFDYPSSTWTSMAGISNAGTVVGNTNVNGSVFSFIYQKGIFEVISAPNAVATAVSAISLRLGLIIGTATFETGTTPPTTAKGYIANCN